MESWVPVLVALLGAGGPATVFLSRLDKRNSQQHEDAIRRQERTLTEVTLVRGDISRLQRRLDRHLEFHADTRA